MSTPTINTAATQGLARVVTSLDDQVQDARTFGPPNFGEVVELAERMRPVASGALDGILSKVWAAAEAIDKAEAQITSGHVETSDLLDIEPDALTKRVLESCRDRATREALAYQNAHYFRDALARTAGEALAEGADVVTENLRADFDKHVKAITAAVAAGITEETDASGLLASGTPEQIAAYRALPAAVVALDQIADLRNTLTRVLRYGPPVHPVFSFVTGIKTTLDAEGLASRYDDRTEVVQYNQDFTGSALTRVRVNRLGGRWLALATYPGGVELHLNTAAEVRAQRDGLAG